MASMVNVGGKLYPSDSVFTLDYGYGPADATAAQAAAWYNTALNVSKEYKSADSWSNYDGYIELKTMGTQQQEPAAPAPAAPSHGGGGGGGGSAPNFSTGLIAPKKIEPGKKIDTGNKQGLESTIKNVGKGREDLVRNYLGPTANSTFVPEDPEARREKKRSWLTQRDSYLSSRAFI